MSGCFWSTAAAKIIAFEASFKCHGSYATLQRSTRYQGKTPLLRGPFSFVSPRQGWLLQSRLVPSPSQSAAITKAARAEGRLCLRYHEDERLGSCLAYLLLGNSHWVPALPLHMDTRLMLLKGVATDPFSGARPKALRQPG